MNGSTEEIGARVTGFILIVVMHLVLAWDIYAGLRWGPSSTISWVLNGWCKQYPIIAFGFGLVIGHIIWTLR